MLKSCSKQGPTFKPLSTKETLFFLLHKLQDKESQISQMRVMIDDRDDKIANLEKYVGALIEKMRELEYGENAKKKLSRGTQTRLDGSNYKRQSWYEARKGNLGYQSSSTPREGDSNPYATLPRNRLGRRKQSDASKGNSLKVIDSVRSSQSASSLVTEEKSDELDSSAATLHSLTVRLLRSELSKVAKDIQKLEKCVRDSISVKERKIKNAENDIHSGKQKLRSSTIQLREIHADSSSQSDVPTASQEVNRLEENMKFLHQEVKHKATEVFSIEENIQELLDISKALQNTDQFIQQTLEIDPEIFAGRSTETDRH